MDVPPVQYARTSDGFNIAYSEMGIGYPLVFVPSIPGCHARENWNVFGFANRPLAAQFRHILYDARGCGLSQRPNTDFSLEAILRDFDAVTERAGIDRCAIWSNVNGVPLALGIAANRAAMVSHVILLDGWISHRHEQPVVAQAANAVRELDWEVFTEYFGRVLIGLGDDLAPRLAAWLRECCDKETYEATTPERLGYDVEAFARRVSSPTLVVHTRGRLWLPEQAGMELAALIPGSQLVFLEDDPSWSTFPALVGPFVLGGAAVGTSPGTIRGYHAEAAAVGLSQRELEVLRLLAAGKTNPQIADALCLSPHTVSRHVSNIFAKIGAANRAEATAWAIRHGLAD